MHVPHDWPSRCGAPAKEERDWTSEEGVAGDAHTLRCHPSRCNALSVLRIAGADRRSIKRLLYTTHDAELPSPRALRVHTRGGSQGSGLGIPSLGIVIIAYAPRRLDRRTWSKTLNRVRPSLPTSPMKQ